MVSVYPVSLDFVIKQIHLDAVQLKDSVMFLAKPVFYGV